MQHLKFSSRKGLFKKGDLKWEGALFACLTSVTEDLLVGTIQYEAGSYLLVRRLRKEWGVLD